MIRALIDLIVSIFKALFKFKDTINQEHQQQAQQEQEHLQEHQQHLQDEYNKIDSQHQTKPNPTIQEVGDKLNDRF